MINANIYESMTGCLYGGALGDAMGQPFEGKPGPIDYKDYVPWKISDDTQMTLATCEAIIKAGKVLPEVIAEQFLLWYRKRRITGVGASTLKALRDLDAGAHWALSGAQGENALGNGAAMRIAPLAYFLNPSNTNHRITIRDVCRITHHSDEAYLGALAVMIAIHSTSTKNLFKELIHQLPDSRVRDRIIEIDKLPNDLAIKEVGAMFGASAYVVESVPLAMYATRQIDFMPIQNVLKSVVEAGGDTDTIASMTGQIVGAWIGSSRIPKDQIQLLPNLIQINQIADEFFKVNKEML